MPEIKIIYKVAFDKGGRMRYISHLDLMRLFSRAIRRTGLKLYLTKGFNPHIIIRIKNALKLGLSGKDQESEIVISERIGADEFKLRLQGQLPDGITIKKCEIR